MTFKQAIASGFKNYANVTGRATRSEYWFWMLFYILGSAAMGVLDATFFHSQPDISPFQSLFALGMLVPTIAVEVRRLHDVNCSGWWMLIALTIVGIFFPLLVWKCTEGTQGENRYGPAPSNSVTAAV